MENRDIIKHLMDVKERLASIETLNTEIKRDLSVHSEASLQMRAEVDIVKAEVAEAKTVLTTLRWALGAALLTMPAIAATLLKLYNSF